LIEIQINFKLSFCFTHFYSQPQQKKESLINFITRHLSYSIISSSGKKYDDTRYRNLNRELVVRRGAPSNSAQTLRIFCRRAKHRLRQYHDACRCKRCHYAAHNFLINTHMHGNNPAEKVICSVYVHYMWCVDIEEGCIKLVFVARGRGWSESTPACKTFAVSEMH